MKTYRIKCDSKNYTSFIDERSGITPRIVRNEPVAFEIGIFQDEEFLTPTTGVVSLSITDSEGNTLAEVITTSLNATVTAQQWRNGTAALVTLVMDGDTTDAIDAGSYTINLTAQDADDDLAISVFLEAPIDVVDLALTNSTPPTPGPPTSYSEAEADALFASQSDMTAAQADITALEALDVVLYSSQTLTAPEKTQARTNIGAAGMGVTVGSIAGNALDFDSYDTWYEQLTADKTLTATGTVTSSKLYTITLAQDATGGWDIAWPAGFTVNPEAIINPYPSTLTAFQVIQNRVAGGSFAKTIGLIDALPMIQSPSFGMDCRTRSRFTFSSGTSATSFTDPLSDETWTYVTARGSYTASAIRTRAAMRMVATTGYILSSSAADKLIDDSIPAGLTVACVFTSSGTAEARLAHLGPIGLSIDQTGGGIKFGSLSTDANRVSVPFTPNDDIATLAIFVYHAGGGASAYVAKHGLGAKVAYASAAAAATASGNYELFQVSGGTARWDGDVSLMQVWDRAFSWDQVQSLAKSLLADFNIVP